MSFSKRPGRNTPQCYTKPLDSLKNWNNRFFWVDERVFSTVVDWRTNAPKDGMPAAGTYSLEAVRELDTHRTPIQKQPEMLLCLVGISRRYYLGDEVYPIFLHDDDRDTDLFNLIRAPNPTKVKVGSRPRAPHEVPLLTLTTPRVIEMDEPAAKDSSGVSSTIERSPLDFAHEAGASDQGAAAPEIPSSKDVPATIASGVGQAEEADTMDPLTAPESRKRGHDGIDVNAPPKSLRRDYADPQPSGSSHPLSFVDAPSRHPADVAQSSQGIAAAGDPRSENASSPAEVGSAGSVYRPKWGINNGSLLDTPEACQDLYTINLARQVAMGSQLRLRFEQEAKLLRKFVAQVARRDQRIQARELEIKNLEARPETEAGMKKAAEDKSSVLIKELEDLRARFSYLQVGNDHLSQQVATLQEQDAPMDVIMAALYLESDIGEDAPQYIRDLRPSSSQLTIPVYSKVRDPRNPWAYKEEIKLSDAIVANITRAEKKKKCRIVCRTHGVGSAHHARSDGVPVSVPTVVPQGLALLLVDAATQTGFEDT
uniref:Transposase (Putative), gypsy type n=1 Tax=Tanacetum cinerariifolium TaxID=118510 RepID=A0A6L2NKH7_TANCI|nr:hypothetical protein [Tanacetum cinerariifolium]